MMTVARLVNKTVRLVLAAWIGLFVTACGDSPQAFLAQYSSIDLVIENGNVVDGLGNPAVRADVVVVGERIVFVGPTEFTETDKRERIARTIDAGGRLVTPGFIDLHSHGDPYDTPQFENFLAMGVTTITLGQDGSSPTVPDLREWLEGISANGIGTNLAMFVGHGTLRTLSGIGRVEDPAAEDMSRMLTMLDDALDYTFGMSSGLEYNPGLNASKDELLQLARIVG
jgi:N-acyl-D-amino-acid deacylase